MSLWTNTDASNGAPKFAGTGGLGLSANTQGTLYANTKASFHVPGAAVGVFGVDPTEKGILGSDGKSSTHAGWVLRKAGMGPIVSITANTGAVGANGTVIFTGGNKGLSNVAARQTGGVTNPLVEARANVAVNAAGYITSIVIDNPGFYANTPAIAYSAAVGNGSFTIVMGGRANRVHTETLVAMGSMVGDGSDDIIYPDS
jgi:hypothetical protein